MNVLLKQPWLWSNVIVLAETIFILLALIVFSQKVARRGRKEPGLNETKETIWSVIDLYNTNSKNNINHKTPNPLEKNTQANHVQETVLSQQLHTMESRIRGRLFNRGPRLTSKID
ncbi:MAG: hypothetical protein AB7F64_09090 [Gammaproteobacteria bacterium]